MTFYFLQSLKTLAHFKIFCECLKEAFFYKEPCVCYGPAISSCGQTIDIVLETVTQNMCQDLLFKICEVKLDEFGGA